MALGESLTFVEGPLKLGSTNVAIYWGTGAPEGDRSPWSDMLKGSVYFRTDATDDCGFIYGKVDENDADEDWAVMVANKDGAAVTIDSDWTLDEDASLYLRDTGQRIYSPSVNVGALALAVLGDTWQIGDQSGNNLIQIDFNGEATLSGTARFNSRGAYELFDDFDMQQTWVEAETPWILLKGSDGSAAYPTLSSAERGVVVLTTGAGDGSTAQDGSQLVCHIPVQADSGGLVFETRLHINTAITNVSVCAGLTDSQSLEEPFTNAADVITSTATDACCFLYDTSATTDEWWTLSVDTDSDDSGNAACGTAPTADTYQKLRIEVSSDGNTIKYYIDDTLEATLSNTGVTPDTDLYATVIACGDGTASKTVDVDYIYVGHNR